MKIKISFALPWHRYKCDYNKNCIWLYKISCCIDIKHTAADQTSASVFNKFVNQFFENIFFKYFVWDVINLGKKFYLRKCTYFAKNTCLCMYLNVCLKEPTTYYKNKINHKWQTQYNRLGKKG